MIIDCHTHIFSSRIIAAVTAKSAMVEKLKLHTSFAAGRTTISALKDDCRSSGIDACLILPTAGAANVRNVNTASIQLAAGSDFLFTAGTLHPFYGDNKNELLRLQEHGVRAIKLCSFSQGFALSTPETFDLFNIIESANSLNKRQHLRHTGHLLSCPRLFRDAGPEYHYPFAAG